MLQAALERSGLAQQSGAGKGALAGGSQSSVAAGHALWVVFSGNFVGIACARTLHVQFYSWCVG